MVQRPGTEIVATDFASRRCHTRNCWLSASTATNSWHGATAKRAYSGTSGTNNWEAVGASGQTLISQLPARARELVPTNAAPRATTVRHGVDLITLNRSPDGMKCQ